MEVTSTEDFPGGPVAKTAFPTQGAWVQSLPGTRSYMPPLRVCVLRLKLLHAVTKDPTC